MPRPRGFDADAALDAIKATFWTYGYEGTSIQRLEDATGLKKQSLYRLYGDKRGMYLAALKAYDEHENAAAIDTLTAEGSARDRLKRLFTSLIDDADPRGCLMCNAGTDQAALDDGSGAAVRAMLSRLRQAFEAALGALDDYRQDDRLRAGKAAALVASYIGLRVLIKAGEPADRLHALVADIMKSL